MREGEEVKTPIFESVMRKGPKLFQLLEKSWCWCPLVTQPCLRVESCVQNRKLVSDYNIERSLNDENAKSLILDARQCSVVSVFCSDLPLVELGSKSAAASS